MTAMKVIITVARDAHLTRSDKRIEFRDEFAGCELIECVGDVERQRFALPSQFVFRLVELVVSCEDDDYKIYTLQGAA
jgi:hypothetical protein